MASINDCGFKLTDIKTSVSNSEKYHFQYNFHADLSIKWRTF